ncbi:MAG: hypothetical protein Q8J90_08085 [Gallionella sp.]|nr:hypothetical protein [Gallionella sp.]
MAASEVLVEIGLHCFGILARLHSLPEIFLIASQLVGLEFLDADLFLVIGVRPFRDQQFCKILVSPKGRDIKGIDFSALGDQQFGDLLVSHNGGEIKRSAAMLFHGIDIRAFGDQQFGNILVPRKDREMKRSGAIMVFGIDVRAIDQPLADFFYVTRFSRRQKAIVGARKRVCREDTDGQRQYEAKH